MTSVKQYGFALENLPNDIRGYKAILHEAVRENGEAFKLASLDIRGDCDVVLEAAEHNSSSLQHANLTRLASDNTTSHATLCRVTLCSL